MTRAQQEIKKKLMASKPRRCEFLLIIIFVISQMHVSLLEKRGVPGFGCHDVAGHQPVRKNSQRGKNGNPPQCRSAQRCCATNIEFQIWQVIYRDHERCKETYLRVACMCLLPHFVYFFGGSVSLQCGDWRFLKSSPFHFSPDGRVGRTLGQQERTVCRRHG